MREKDKQMLASHYLDLYRMAFALLRNEADTEDCVQEALAATMSRALLIDPYRYCTKVLYNQCRQMLRRRGYQLPNQLPDMADASEDSAMHEYRLIQLAQLKQQLPQRLKQIIDLYYLDGYTQAQIAAQQGISESMVKKLLYRGKNKLRQQMIDIEEKKESF